MRFTGWVKVGRSILGDLYEGKLTVNEFAVWTILTLCADAKTGSYFINASALGTFTGNQLSVDSAQRALKGLDDKGYILRKPTQRREVYPYIIHRYEVTVGEHKGKQVNILKTTNIDKPFYEQLAAGEGAVESAAGVPGDTAGDSAVQDAAGAADKTRTKNQEVRSDKEEVNEVMNEAIIAPLDQGSKAKSVGGQEKPESNSSIWVKTDEVNLHLDLVKHFSSCLGKEIPAAAEPSLRGLFEKSGLTEIQFAGFLFWALSEYDFTSRYLRIAKDPIASFEKNCAENLNRYKVETDFVRKGRPSAEWKIDPKSVLRRFNLFCNPPFPANYIERLEDSEAYRVLNWWAEVNARGEMYMYLGEPEPQLGEDGCIIIGDPSNLVGPYPLIRKAFLELVNEEESEYSIPEQLYAEACSDSCTTDSSEGLRGATTVPCPLASDSEASLVDERDDSKTEALDDAAGNSPEAAGSNCDALAIRCAKFFHGLLENDLKYAACSRAWPEVMRFLLNETQFVEQEFKEFVRWALLENSSENPKYSSVDYLHAANDPALTLKKYSEILTKVFKARKKAKKIKDDIATPDWLKRDKIMLDNIIAKQREGGMSADELLAEMERTGLSMEQVLEQHATKLAAQVEGKEPTEG